MTSVALVVAAWLLFAGTHIGLATPRVRARLIAWLGEGGFRLGFFAIAAVAFTVLVRAYALHQHVGPAGLGAGVGPTLRLALWGTSALGATLLVAGLVAYPASPMELGGSGTSRPTRLGRITRHPFFVGLGLVAVAHAVLATHLTGTAFFAGLALFTLLGARQQDRKLLASRGDVYAAYCRETSVVPFAAILRRETPFGARDLPAIPLLIGVLGATAIRWAHPHILAWDGMAVVAVGVGGAIFFGVTSLVRLALRAGHGPALATAGGILVLQVGLAHELVGAQLYPEGPAMLGGPVVWHAVGLAGIAMGIVMTGGALGLLAMPPRIVTTSTILVGIAFVVVDAVVRGGFHFFAATLVVGASLVRAASDSGPMPNAAARS